jgi:hypothetical protein
MQTLRWKMLDVCENRLKVSVPMNEVMNVANIDVVPIATIWATRGLIVNPTYYVSFFERHHVLPGAQLEIESPTVIARGMRPLPISVTWPNIMCGSLIVRIDLSSPR